MTSKQIKRWTTNDLVALVPGSTSRAWRRVYIPRLIACGALVEGDRGGWLGRQSEIETALLDPARELSCDDRLRETSQIHASLRWLRILDAHSTYANAAIALATGGMSAVFGWAPTIPLLVLGAGLLAGRLAKTFE